MSSLLVLLAACSNVAPPPWAGGGTRYASGYTADYTGDEDSGGSDTGGGGGAGAPELLTASASYTAPNEADQVFILVGIAYSDDPDDIVGGNLYYTLYANGEQQDEGSRPIVDDGADPLSDAWLDSNGNIVFQVGPVDDTMTHTLNVHVRDYTRNESNEIPIEVTSR